MSKFCFKCGAELKDNAKFCPKCGEPVKAQTLPTAQKCAECGAELKATSKFCPACGKPVVDRQAETAVQTVKHDTEVTKAKEQINRGIKTIAQTVERTMFSAPVTPGGIRSRLGQNASESHDYCFGRF